jgi:hypothetical protein
METKPLYTLRKHSIVLTPGMLNTVLAYIRYVHRSLRTKLEEYRTAQNQSGSTDIQAVNAGETTAAQVQREIARAEEVAQDVELLRDEVKQIYLWHFTKMAEVWRTTRLELGLSRIEEVQELKLALTHTMRMLKAENPQFSEEKFIQFINN